MLNTRKHLKLTELTINMDLIGLPIFPFVLMCMLIILFAWRLLLLLKLSSLPFSHCGLVNDGIQDSVTGFSGRKCSNVRSGNIRKIK